jgi:hypothetical protein
VAVVALGQRRIEVVRQPLETAEMGHPLLVGERLQPHRRGGAVAAKAQDRLREFLRPHRIGELRTELGELRVRTIEG